MEVRRNLLRELRLALHKLSNLRRIGAPAWLRNYRAWIFQVYIIISLLAFSLLALMAEVFDYTTIDLEITRWLQSSVPDWFGVLATVVNWPGYAPQAFILVGGTIILLGMANLRWEAIASLFAALSTGLLNYLVKVAVRRPRPGQDLVEVVRELSSYSFPSGHVMFYTAYFGFLLFLIYILLTRSWRRRLLIAPLAALIALVGVSRMAAGEHWASDVLAGYLLGSLSLLLAVTLYRWGKNRFFPVDPLSEQPADEAR